MKQEPGEVLTKWKKGLEILKGLPVRAGRGYASTHSLWRSNRDQVADPALICYKFLTGRGWPHWGVYLQFGILTLQRKRPAFVYQLKESCEWLSGTNKERGVEQRREASCNVPAPVPTQRLAWESVPVISELRKQRQEDSWGSLDSQFSKLPI